MTATIRDCLACSALLILAAAGARAEELEVEPDQALITVDAAAGSKQLSAVSRSLEWKMIAYGGDRAEVHARVPLDSFDSGHPQLDAALRKAGDWTGHPVAEL